MVDATDDISTATEQVTNTTDQVPDATDQVLGINELLEAILASLPPISLFRPPQVCKRWQAAVRDSPTLQHKLFLKPEAGSGRIVYASVHTCKLFLLLAPLITSLTQLSIKAGRANSHTTS